MASWVEMAAKKHDAPSHADGADEPASERRPKRLAHGELVLVVDDHEDTRVLFSEVLELWGFESIAAADGNEALAVALARRPRVVLMDLSMPGSDGWEATARIKAEPELRGIVVVGVTGHVEPSALARAHEAGVDAVVWKPVEPTALMNTIAVLLDLPWRGGD